MSESSDCIFCKIVAGQIPCFKLHEDDRVLAFLDVGPLSDGHALIIPKKHYVTLDEMPAEDAAACAAIAPKLARAIQAATGTKAFNFLQNNGREAHQAVMHVHFHIIPKTAAAGLGISWPAKQIDKERGKQLQQAIVERMVEG